MRHEDIELDAKGFDVYEAIYECGGEAVTTDIKEYTGIKKNAIIHYRLDKMEEQGVVEIGVGEAVGGRTPPKKAMLTEKGRELAKNGLFSEEEPSIVERVERTERRMGVVESEFQELTDEFRSWRYDEENDEEVDIRDILDRLEKFEALTENVEDDALEKALEVVSRLERVEEALRTKQKYLGRSRSFTQEKGDGEVTVEGIDIFNAVENLEYENAQMAAALREEGIEPPRGRDEYFALEDGKPAEEDA